MKILELENRHYKHLLKGFREWLRVLGYAETTVYSNPNTLIEFLYFIENRDIQHVRLVDKKVIEDYFKLLKNRENIRKGGKISDVHYNGHVQVLKKFTKYLFNTKRINLPTYELQYLKLNKNKKVILTVEEVKSLFEVTDNTPFGYRDRAMLSVYYGCGLRRNEGISLNVEDVLFNRGLIYVRKGKNYKERYVPITPNNLKHIEDYLNKGRKELLREIDNEKALFIGQRKNRVQSQSILKRLKHLQQLSAISSLKKKEIGLHTLRHSIATHLLQAGMELEKISTFLGHSSLESTQVYTHIVNQFENEEV